MRKVAAIIAIAIAAAHLAAVAPESGSIGRVVTDVEPGSITETALAAAREPYTEEWLARYTADPIIAGEALSPYLSALLPLSNPIAGLEKDGAVELLDLDGGAKVAFIFQDGMIKAAYSSDSPQLPEL